MIEYIKKDLTTLEEGVILHGCNCVGGFGSGVAGAIRRKWPVVYNEFKECGIGNLLLGKTHVVTISEDPVLHVVNGYTQVNCGNDGSRYADLDAVKTCIEDTAGFCDRAVHDLYMPKIGCGLGGLSWENEVKPIVEKVSQDFPSVNIFICDL